MMPKPIKTFASLQAGRAIAALMVVLYHACVILDEPKYWHHSWKQYLAFGHSGVEFFFVLSGIVILHAHWNDQGNPESLKLYAWKRFRRIYPIYWVILALVLTVYRFVPSLGTGAERQPTVTFSSIILIHVRENLTILGSAWTLYHEIMFYIIFGLIILNRRVGLTVLASWMSCSVYALLFPPVNPVLNVYTSPLHLLFAFGMIAVWVVRSRAIPVPGLVLLLGLSGFIATSVYESRIGRAVPMGVICYGAAATLCALGAMELERSGRLVVSKVLSFLGDASYSIYLVHQLALSVLAKLIYPLALRLRVPLIVPFLLLTAGSVGIGILVHIFAERPLLKAIPAPKRKRLLPVSAPSGI